MQQFNLDKWLKDKSRKVVTRDRRNVFLSIQLCKNEYYPVIGMVEGDKDVKTWTNEGINIIAVKKGAYDLFFADEEKELTEFEKGLNYFLRDWIQRKDDYRTVEEATKESSNKLLDLARKEILKDLPKWKRSNSFFNTGNKFELGKTSLRRFDGYEIPYSELEKLPKE